MNRATRSDKELLTRPRGLPDADLLTEAVRDASVSPETRAMLVWLRELHERVEALERGPVQIHPPERGRSS